MHSLEWEELPVSIASVCFAYNLSGWGRGKAAAAVTMHGFTSDHYTSSPMALSPSRKPYLQRDILPISLAQSWGNLLF